MPTPTLGSDQYPDIRAAIDVSLDAGTLPDSVIGLDLYLGEANRWADDKSAHLDTSTTAAKMQLKNAAVYYCAALVVHAIPSIVSERKVTGEGYSRQQVDVEKLRAFLLSRAESYISLITVDVDTVTEAVPTLFTAAHGTRGR